MRSLMLLRNLSVTLSIVLGVALPISLQGCAIKNNYGADTPEQVIEQYLLALENKNEGLMRQLIPSEYSADQAVKDKIAQLGGHKIKEHKVVYTKPKPVFLRADVQGFYTSGNGVDKRFEDTLTIAYKGGSLLQFNRGRWYLLLGKGKAPDPRVQPAEPQTSPPKKSP